MSQQYEDWSTCFWCGVAQWGYGDTEAQAKFQARNNKLGHENSCSQKPESER